MTNSYRISRSDMFLGKTLKYGESSTNQPIRLSSKKGKWIRNVHETWTQTGTVGRLNNPLLHISPYSFAQFIRKIDSYSTQNANMLYAQGKRASWFDIIVYPKAKFIKNYFFLQGFRDGTHGFVHAMAMSLHSFLTRAKLWQIEDQKNHERN